MDWNYVRDAAIALMPTLGVCVLFYVVMKAIMNADRNERQAEKAIDQAAEAAKTAVKPTTDGRAKSAADSDPH